MTEAAEGKKSKYSKNDLMHMIREDLVNRFLKQQSQVEYLNDKFEKLNEDIIELKDINVKSSAKINEQNQKEAMLINKLARKDQEINDLLAQLHDIKQLQMPSSVQLQSCLLDPAVNITIQNLTKELEMCKEKLKVSQEDLEAVKFTPESQLGKRLVEKCRTLQKENEELGQMLKSGSVAKLESELALKQNIIDSFFVMHEGFKEALEDNEVEICGMEFAMKDLTEKLKLSQQQTKSLQTENETLKKLLEKAQNATTNVVDKTPTLKRNDDANEKSGSKDVDHKTANPTHKTSSSNNKDDNRDGKSESEQRLKKLIVTSNNHGSNKISGRQRQSRSQSKEKPKKSSNTSPESVNRTNSDEKKAKNYENCNGRNRSRSPRHSDGKGRNVNDYTSRRKSPHGTHHNDSSDKTKKRKYDDDYDNDGAKSRRYDDDRTRDRERERTNKHSSDYSSRSGRTTY